jgi:hypothetical protein
MPTYFLNQILSGSALAAGVENESRRAGTAEKLLKSGRETRLVLSPD